MCLLSRSKELVINRDQKCSEGTHCLGVAYKALLWFLSPALKSLGQRVLQK